MRSIKTILTYRNNYSRSWTCRDFYLFVLVLVITFRCFLNVTVIYCSKLQVPLNGGMSTTETVFNTVVTVRCDSGFILSDGRLAKILHCMEDGKWNDSTVNICRRMNSFFAFTWCPALSQKFCDSCQRRNSDLTAVPAWGSRPSNLTSQIKMVGLFTVRW